MGDASGRSSTNGELHGSTLVFEVNRRGIHRHVQGKRAARLRRSRLRPGSEPDDRHCRRTRRRWCPPGPGGASLANGDTLVVADEAVIVVGASDDRPPGLVSTGTPIDVSDSFPRPARWTTVCSGCAPRFLGNPLRGFRRDSVKLHSVASIRSPCFDQTRRTTGLVGGFNPKVSTPSGFADMAMDTTRRLCSGTAGQRLIELSSLDGSCRQLSEFRHRATHRPRRDFRWQYTGRRFRHDRDRQRRSAPWIFPRVRSHSIPPISNSPQIPSTWPG